jgi:hypothetical protein
VIFLRLAAPHPLENAAEHRFKAGSRKGRAAKSNNQPERKSMSNLNVTVLMGRLVRAPIIRNNGSKMGFFYIASNRRYRDKAEVAQEETAFVACKCFGGWTDALARHQKGDMVMVEGRLRTETWKSAFNSTSQPRFPSLCPKIESSSARNVGGVLFQHH